MRTIDRESAYEILNKKLDTAREFDLQVPDSPNKTYDPKPRTTTRTTTRKEKSTVDKVINSPLSKQIGRTLVREISRGILRCSGFWWKKKIIMKRVSIIIIVLFFSALQYSQTISVLRKC